MRRRTKILLAISAGVASLGALGWWSKHSPWLSERLREPLRSALVQASGRDVHIGGVGAGFSGWIWLQDVALGPDPAGRPLDMSFTAKAVGLRFDLLRLLSGRPALGDLRGVRVEAPRLFLLRSVTDTASVKSARAWSAAVTGFPVPPVGLDLRRGELWDHPVGGAPQRVAEELRLGVEPDRKGWRLRGQFELPGDGGRVALWGRSGPRGEGLQLKARVSALRLRPWAERLGLPSAWRLEDGRLQGVWEWSRKDGAWRLGGFGDLADLTVRWREAVVLEQGQGRWRLDDGVWHVNALRARAAGGSLEGELDWTADASLRLQLRLRQARLETWLPSVPLPRALLPAGTVDANLTAAGPLSATAWNLTLAGHTGSLGPLRALALRAQGVGVSGTATVEWDWAPGRARLELGFDAQGLAAARWESIQAPLDGRLPASGLDVEGRVDGTLAYRRDPKGAWEAGLVAPQLRLGGRELERLSLKGWGDRERAQLRLDGDLPAWRGLGAEVDAFAAGGVWKLKNVRVLEGKHVLAEAEGSFDPASGEALNLKLRRAAVPLLSLQSYLPASLATLSGTLQAQGHLRWTRSGVAGELALLAPDATLRGQSLDARGTLFFAPQGLSLGALSLRGGELEAEATAPALDGPWSWRAQWRRAALPAWCTLLDSPLKLSGTAEGRLEWSARPLPRGRLELNLDGPWPRYLPGATAALKLAFEDGRWRLDSLALRQGAGRLDAQGRLDPRGREPWSGAARWSGLRLSGLPFEGSAVLEGGGGGRGRLRVEAWSLSGTALPALDAALDFGDASLRSVTAALGTATTFRLKRQGTDWMLRSDFHAQDPGPLAGPWLGSAQPLGLSLSGWAEARFGGGPGRWSLNFVDDGVPGSRFNAAGTLEPAKLVTADGAALDLARFGRVLQRAGLDLPLLAGRLSGTAQAAADGLSLSASVEGLVLGGQALGLARLNAWIGPAAWRVERFEAGTGGRAVFLRAASGAWNGGAWQAQGRVGAEDWPVALFHVGGEAMVKASGQGGASQAALRFDRLQVNERTYKDLDLDLRWGDGHVTVVEASSRPAFGAEARWGRGVFEIVRLESTRGRGKAGLKGRLGPEGRLDFEGSAQAYPAEELTRLLGWTQDWRGAVFGTLSLKGRSDSVSGVISVKIEDGSVAGLPFDLATGLVHLEPGWVQLSPLRPIRVTRRNGVALEVTGKVPLDAGPGTAPEGLEVDATLKDGGLGLLAGTPALTGAEGLLELSLNFRGRRDDPTVNGRLRIEDGRLDPAWLLPKLEKVDVFAQMVDGQVLLQRAQARVAEGGPLLKLENVDPDRPAFRFERWVPADFNLRLRASRSGLPLRHTLALRFLEGTAHPDLALRGSWEAPRLEGTLGLERGEHDRAVLFWPPRFAKGGGGVSPEDFFGRLEYNLRLDARRDVMVRTDAAQVFIDTGEKGLRLSGRGGERELEGRLRLNGGSIDYLLANFQISKDRETYIDFRPGNPPALELWAEKHVRDVLFNGERVPRDVTVRLHAFGALGNVQMQLESGDAGLSQEQLASIAGFGVDISDPRSQQGGFARLLGKGAGSLLSNFVKNSGVVDEVSVRVPGLENALAPRSTPGPGESGFPVSGSARTLVEVGVVRYIGQNVAVGVVGAVNERQDPQGGTQVDPALGGKLELQLEKDTRVSAQHNVDREGQTEQRVMIERSTRFENYNPRKRRWDVQAGAVPTPTPSPAARP